jgi:nicotinate-nucleotide adenylyltransferase
MRIGIMGGTFDPIHHGHLILARDAFEALDLHKIIFVPNHLSPHKMGASSAATAPAELRAGMVRAAIEGEPGFEIDEVELHRGGTSYTIDTLLHLRTIYPEDDLFYLVGEDNLPELHTWRRVDEILILVQLVVMARGDGGSPHPYITLPQRRVDISATDIRARIAKGQSIRYLVPDKVRTMIENHQLYREVPSS